MHRLLKPASKPTVFVATAALVSLSLALLAPGAAAAYAEGDRPGPEGAVCFLSAQAEWKEFFGDGKYYPRGHHVAWIYAPTTPACPANGELYIALNPPTTSLLIDACEIPHGLSDNCDTGDFDVGATTDCWYIEGKTFTLAAPLDPVFTPWEGTPVCDD